MNHSQFLISGFIRSPLQNGVGRHINQLQRITLKFCKSHGSSKGMRDFIENHLVNFAKANQSCVVYVKPRRHRGPVIVAEYLNGDRRWMSARKKTEGEILKWVSLMALQAGDTEPIRYRKNWHTDMPSIQGPWTPFTHKNPAFNLASFPNKDLGTKLDLPETATEKLMRLMKEQQKLESK